MAAPDRRIGPQQRAAQAPVREDSQYVVGAGTATTERSDVRNSRRTQPIPRQQGYCVLDWNIARYRAVCAFSAGSYSLAHEEFFSVQRTTLVILKGHVAV